MFKNLYLFPRSHATAYVKMALKIGYFKLYHPIYFYKASLNRKIEFILDSYINLNTEEIKSFYTNMNNVDNKDKNTLQVMKIFYEIKSRNIKIAKITLEISDATYFTIQDDMLIPPLMIFLLGCSSIFQNELPCIIRQ